MPCFCWISDSQITQEMSSIRSHAKEIIRLAKEIHRKGHLLPSVKSSPMPRAIMDDIHTLLNDYWAGKCSETGELV